MSLKVFILHFGFKHITIINYFFPYFNIDCSMPKNRKKMQQNAFFLFEKGWKSSTFLSKNKSNILKVCSTLSPSCATACQKSCKTNLQIFVFPFKGKVSRAPILRRKESFPFFQIDTNSSISLQILLPGTKYYSALGVMLRIIRNHAAKHA